MSSPIHLVTGGSGFIGAALVTRLVHGGHRVRVLDNNSRGSLRRLARVIDEIEFVRGDVRDPDAVREAARGVRRVIHLAAVNGTEFFYSKPELVLDVAIRGMLNVVDACRFHGIGDLVVASSSEAYQTPPVIPTPEDVPLVVPDVTSLRYSYGGGKIATELIAMIYGLTGFERLTVFRPHNVYGPDMGWEHVVPQFSLRAGEAAAAHPRGPLPFPVKGGGGQTRAFVHIDDFIDGVMLVLERGAHRTVYHIGSDEEVTIADLARRVVAALGREPRIIHDEAFVGETLRRCPDIRRLRELGYAPRIPLDQGLPPVVAWYLENAHLRSVSN